jgi:hypothetical protein
VDALGLSGYWKNEGGYYDRGKRRRKARLEPLNKSRPAQDLFRDSLIAGPPPAQPGHFPQGIRADDIRLKIIAVFFSSHGVVRLRS